MSPYNATREHAPFVVSENSNGGHPRPRTGATKKRRDKLESRRANAVAEPVMKKKK